MQRYWVSAKGQAVAAHDSPGSAFGEVDKDAFDSHVAKQNAAVDAAWSERLAAEVEATNRRKAARDEVLGRIAEAAGVDKDLIAEALG